jgi:hypothetical protein
VTTTSGAIDGASNPPGTYSVSDSEDNLSTATTSIIGSSGPFSYAYTSAGTSSANSSYLNAGGGEAYEFLMVTAERGSVSTAPPIAIFAKTIFIQVTVALGLFAYILILGQIRSSLSPQTLPSRFIRRLLPRQAGPMNVAPWLFALFPNSHGRSQTSPQ